MPLTLSGVHISLLLILLSLFLCQIPPTPTPLPPPPPLSSPARAVGPLIRANTWCADIRGVTEGADLLDAWMTLLSAPQSMNPPFIS